MPTTLKTLACLLAGVVVLAAFQAPAEKPKSDDKPKMASLAGRVVNASSGDPLRKVTLMLTRARGGGSPVTVETDNDGKFQFDNIEPGRYLLFGERTGFARQAYGARANAVVGTSLLFSAGQEVKDLVFKLSPNAVISGKVVDPDGEPIPNCTVMALRTTYQRGKKQFLPLGAAQSNDVGEYRIANMKGGRYIVSATFMNLGMGMAGTSNKPPSDQPEESFTSTFYPNSPDPGGASPVTVAIGGEMRGIDIHMAKVKSFRVKGKVGENAPTKPVIALLTPKGAGVTGLVTRRIAMIQPDGAFEFKGVAPGLYVLSATGSDAISPLGQAQNIQVTDQHIDGLVLGVGAGADVAGTVTVESKDPVSLKSVELTLDSMELISLSPPRSNVADEGKFTFKNVTPDRYQVLTRNGPEGLYVKSVKLGGRDVTDDGLDFSNGVTGPIEVTLSQNGGQIDGSITNADSKPVAGATVVLIPDSRQFRLFKEMTTDQNGSFSFKGIAPGDYKILAWEDLEPGAYQDPDFLKPFSGKASAVSIKENDRKSISLKVIPAEEGGR